MIIQIFSEIPEEYRRAFLEGRLDHMFGGYLQEVLPNGKHGQIVAHCRKIGDERPGSWFPSDPGFPSGNFSMEESLSGDLPKAKIPGNILGCFAGVAVLQIASTALICWKLNKLERMVARQFELLKEVADTLRYSVEIQENEILSTARQAIDFLSYAEDKEDFRKLKNDCIDARARVRHHLEHELRPDHYDFVKKLLSADCTLTSCLCIAFAKQGRRDLVAEELEKYSDYLSQIAGVLRVPPESYVGVPSRENLERLRHAQESAAIVRSIKVARQILAFEAQRARSLPASFEELEALDRGDGLKAGHMLIAKAERNPLPCPR